MSQNKCADICPWVQHTDEEVHHHHIFLAFFDFEEVSVPLSMLKIELQLVHKTGQTVLLSLEILDEKLVILHHMLLPE